MVFTCLLERLDLSGFVMKGAIMNAQAREHYPVIHDTREAHGTVRTELSSHFVKDRVQLIGTRVLGNSHRKTAERKWDTVA